MADLYSRDVDDVWGMYLHPAPTPNTMVHCANQVFDSSVIDTP